MLLKGGSVIAPCDIEMDDYKKPGSLAVDVENLQKN
jgi:hypothetical protein